MQIIARKLLLPEVKGTSLDTCIHCLAIKQYRLPFNRITAFKKKNFLDLVYSNVCGLMIVSTLGGARYFITVIDDHTRKIGALF